jgi:mRNA interferase MazF
VVVSPDELNHHLNTVIVAPLTTGGRPYPWRVECAFAGRSGSVAIDQLRRLGLLDAAAFDGVLHTLREMFGQ